jgi:hypothetical protein
MATESFDNWVGLALKQNKILLNLLAHGTFNIIYPTNFDGREFHIIEIVFSPVKIEFTYDPSDDMSTQLSIIRSLQHYIVDRVPIIQDKILLDAILNLVKTGRPTTVITEMYNGICELIDTINNFSQENLNLKEQKHIRVQRLDGGFEFVEMPIKANQVKIERFCKLVKNTLEDLDIHGCLANCDQLVRHTNNMRSRTAQELRDQKPVNERENKKRKLEDNLETKQVKKSVVNKEKTTKKRRRYLFK